MRTPKSVVQAIALAFCGTALVANPGGVVKIADAWEKILTLIGKSKPDLVLKLNKDDCKAAFTWLLAGFVEGIPIPEKHSPVFILRFKNGPNKSKYAACRIAPDGAMVRIPKSWKPRWPLFVCEGDRCYGKPVFCDTLVNTSLLWPSPVFADALKKALWEPSGKALKRLAARRKPRKQRRAR